MSRDRHRGDRRPRHGRGAARRRATSGPTGRGSCIVWDDPINLMDYVVLRVPEAVRLLAREGDAADAAGAQRGQGRSSRTAPARSARSTSPGCTRTASGRRCSTTMTRDGRCSTGAGATAGSSCTLLDADRRGAAAMRARRAAQRLGRARPTGDGRSDRLFPARTSIPPRRPPRREWQALVHDDLVAPSSRPSTTIVALPRRRATTPGSATARSRSCSTTSRPSTLARPCSTTPGSRSGAASA